LHSGELTEEFRSVLNGSSSDPITTTRMSNESKDEFCHGAIPIVPTLVGQTSMYETTIKALFVLAAVVVLCAEGTVRLRVESFDVKSSVGEELNFRRHFLGFSDSDLERQIFIAHMDPKLGTPWSESMIRQATGHDGRLLHVPEHSFLFYATPKVAYKIESLPIVDWVGKLHPRHRKSPIAYPLGYDPENCQVEPQVTRGGVAVHEIVIMMFPLTPERTPAQAKVTFDKWRRDLTDNEKQVKNIDYEFKFWTHDRFAIKTKSPCKMIADLILS
jgi:hypothetical protein